MVGGRISNIEALSASKSRVGSQYDASFVFVDSATLKIEELRLCD
jgi:hypothetical protein